MAGQSVSLNRDGTISVYVGGKKQGQMTLAELVAFAQGPSAPQRKPKKPRQKSRADRWADAASAAKEALEELRAIQEEELEPWRDNIEEKFSGTALYDKLQTICDIDISTALEAAEEAENADMPLGFGRD
jgi:hypothetical protein